MLEGEISEIQLIERLVELWREQFTGAIRFENDGIIKIVYFKSGDVLSASTNDRADSVDEILMRAGKVSREHVKQALAKRKESETLGDALLNLGFITRKELTWARRVQVVGVIRSIAAWTHGSFTIVADYLPKRDEGTLFPLPQLLVELIVTEQDRPRFERAMNGGEAVFAKTNEFDDVFRRLGLNDDAEAIAAEIDGEKSAAQIAVASGRDTFNVYKLLDALATLGILTRVAIPQASHQLSMDDFATAGVADAADMWSEPPQPSEPQFELDDTETIAMPEPEPHVPAYVERPAVSAWDADEDEEPVTTAKMPAWDTPPREPLSVPMPAEIEPPADADEEQWGFDEAQLETVRRASVPLRDRELEPPPDDLDLVDPAAAPPPRAGRRYGFIVALLAIVILAAAGYGAFLWWQARDAASSEPLAVTRSPRVQRPPVTAPTTTSSATEASLTQTSPTQSSVGTTTPAPNAATSTTANAALTTTALPKVVTSSAPPTSAVSTTMAPAMIARNTPPPATAPRTTPSATPPSSAAAPARQPMRVTATQPASAASVPATDTQPLPTFTRKAPPAATTRTRDQYDAMARDYAANATGNYTVQIQILCQESNLAGAIRSGGSEVWFVPQTIAGRACYRVFWGRYATRDAAQSAMALIPASLRDRSAAVKPVPKH